MMYTERINNIENKLMVLRNFDEVFLGQGIRQELPFCCDRELDLVTILRTGVTAVHADVNGVKTLLFEVVCPNCGRTIPPRTTTAPFGTRLGSREFDYKRMEASNDRKTALRR